MSYNQWRFGKREDNVPQSQYSSNIDFTPRMPEVEPIPDDVIQFTSLMAIKKEKRQVVHITPKRIINTLGPLPPPEESMSQVMIAQLKSMVHTIEQANIVAIGMTEFNAFHKDPHRAVHFIEYILGFAQLGHSVILFEGHPLAFSKVCRDSDLLLVDGAMIPFFQTDWKDMAASVMCKLQIVVFERDGRLWDIKK